ncbi:aldo/keto reductase [Halocatena salina]|uniref:Aldo/keto reductase n=1 Tax=Halocatena salina TaxID=2934340 RepID=A0A8U0A7U4_9EURY|nr:aldo/keto reductase [Halocatena salina]UPM45205.1 aldo/keto reductase [Halocatena salina]
METVKLNNDVEMPILGFGTYQIEDLEVCERSVSEALRTGYRLIDTASGYENEEVVGRAIETSDVAREDVFVTTKLWIQDAGYESTKRAFERSLDRLGLDYLDLYLIHQPFGDVHGSWQAMEDLYNDDKIRAIGVSNFHPDRLIDLIVQNEVVPAVNQIETHPFYQRIEDAEFLRRHEIQHESWGPFAEGRNNLFENEVLVSIGEQYSKSAAQVVLRWLIQRGIVAIPKSVHEERMVENFDIFDFELSNEDMTTISELNESESLFPDHRDPEFVKQLSEVEADT